MISLNPKELNRLRVQVLYKQTLIVQIAGFLNAVLYAYIVRDFVPQSWLGAWLSSVGIIYFLRLCLHTWFIHSKATLPFEPSAWENIFSVGVFISGLCWTVADLFFLPLNDPAQSAFLGFLLAGITAAASAAYSTSMRAVLAFLIPAVLPFAYRMFQGGTQFHYGMGALILLYMAVITAAMYRIHQVVLESIRLRFEKDSALQELRETQAKIVHSAKLAALGEMAAGIAHEINTPLGTMQFSLDAITKTLQNEEVDPQTILDATKKLERMIFRISKIVKNLMSFAGQDEEDAPTAVSVQQLLSETMDFCQSRFQNHGILLELKSVSPEFQILCKAPQINRALLNLINNAFDAVKNKINPKVLIEVEESAEHIHFKVTDNGEGIPPEISEKIMQPFFTTKDVGSGTGLGLSVALGIVQSHDGNLTFNSTAEGTCFTMTVPKAKARALIEKSS